MAISKDKYTKIYKEQEEQKGLPGQDKNTATVITPAANFEFKQDFFCTPFILYLVLFVNGKIVTMFIFFLLMFIFVF